MPLHRDIHWIGRQWAVTGHGMQLIDQKLQGFFDIEAARLWDEILIDSVQAKAWINRSDFDKGLAIARARHSQSPGAVTSPRQAAPAPAIEPVTPLAPAVRPIEPKPETPKLGIPKPVAAPLAGPASVEPPTAVSPRQAAPMPALERHSSKPVVPIPIAPGSVEPRRPVAEPLVSAIATQAFSVEPPRPPSLFQMSYQCRARFVRPWRVVARKI